MADTKPAHPAQIPLPWSTLPPEPPLLFVRHPRARRYVIRLTDAGIVRVTIPRGGSRREALAFAEREHGWIARQWARYGEGTDERESHAGRVEDSRERARCELPPRLMALASTHGLSDRVTKVSVRNQKWRWGSCSPTGHICLNWRLVTMPDAVRDYVIIHELMHLRRMDHSPGFWKLVEQACPDYRDHRQYLRSQTR